MSYESCLLYIYVYVYMYSICICIMYVYICIWIYAYIYPYMLLLYLCYSWCEYWTYFILFSCRGGRIDRLTRPTKVLGVAKSKPVGDDKKASVEDDKDASIVIQSTEEEELDASTISDTTNTTKALNANLSSLIQLKRSVSPSTPHGSRDGHVTLGLGLGVGAGVGSKSMRDASDQSDHNNSNNNSNDAFLDNYITRDPNVRGSLTLLKTKTASRRRRSVADIEDSSVKNRPIDDLNQMLISDNLGRIKLIK